MGEWKGVASWVAATVAVLLLIGSGATAYSDLNSELASVLNSIETIERDVKDLDVYDAKLSENIDELDDRLIKSEAEQVGIKRTQDRIEATMKEMLQEIKGMREDIIKMGVRNAS